MIVEELEARMRVDNVLHQRLPVLVCDGAAGWSDHLHEQRGAVVAGGRESATNDTRKRGDGATANV